MPSAFDNVGWKKRVSNTFFPQYVPLLDQINHNAKVKKWLKSNPDVPAFPTRLALYEYVESEFLKGQAINYLEFGVFEGDATRFWCGLNTNPKSQFVGFDSFIGLPEDWNSDRKKGDFDVGGSMPQISDTRVSFVDGWFQKTLPGFLENFTNDKQLVINNDSDLYSSTAYCLAKMDHLIKPGTIIIFDEFSSALNEFRAWNDYLNAFMREAKPIAVTDDFAARAAFQFL